MLTKEVFSFDIFGHFAIGGKIVVKKDIVLLTCFRVQGSHIISVTLFLHMGDSREVPHVNIVRKLRHSCEDVNFASSIYSSTLKQFNFIVDYCLRLHIM